MNRRIVGLLAALPPLLGILAAIAINYLTGPNKPLPGGFDVLRTYSFLSIIILAVVSVGVAWWASKRNVGSDAAPRPIPPVADAMTLQAAAENLASAVRRDWEEERERLRLQIDSIKLRWQTWTRPEEANSADSQRQVRQRKPARAPKATTIGNTYKQSKNGRLVITGPTGSGKSLLAQQLVLQLIPAEVRQNKGRVPVLVNLATWDPDRQSMRDWLVYELVTTYPALNEQTTGGTSLADSLVNMKMILPVMDGLEEVPPRHTPKIIDALNNIEPMVVTCNSELFDALTADNQLIASATVITLDAVTVDDLETFLLPARTTAVAGPAAGEVWKSFIGQLRAPTPAPNLSAVSQALNTPLMAWLAREVYRDRDPQQIFAVGKDGVKAVEEHLIGSYLPALYQRPLTQAQQARRQGRRDWTATDRDEYQNIQRWLGFLARASNGATGSQGIIGWWRLREAVPAFFRISICGLAYTLAGLATLIPILAVFPLRNETDPLPGAFALCLLVGVVGGILTGRAPSAPPVQTRLRFRGTWKQAFRTFIVVFFGAKLLLFIPKAAAFVAGGPAASFPLTVASIALGFTAASIVVMLRYIEQPIRFTSRTDPASSVTSSRRSFILRSAAVSVAAAIGFGVMFGVFYGSVAALVVVALVVPGRIAYVVASTAWGNLTIITRPYLAVTNNCPAALLDFLDDARCRGLLKLSGPVYLFRHEQLRSHLARITLPVPPTPPRNAVDSAPAATASG